MTYLLVKNVVKDYDRFMEVFHTEDEATEEYGLTVERLWREQDAPNVVWFLMRCESRERAEAFMARPESQDVGDRAGVTDGMGIFLDQVVKKGTRLIR